MQPISLFQVDAFTDKLFHGNPAAVCILSEWFNDELLQAIAIENNLSETAFVLAQDDRYHIRWFAPNGEISLCGHATLAAGFVLFELGIVSGKTVSFASLGGILTVSRKENKYVLDLPAINYAPLSEKIHYDRLIDQPVIEAYESDLDYLFVLASYHEVMRAKIHLDYLSGLLGRGLIVTAQGSDCDFHSRCFYPKHHIPEDPVTGSAHSLLTPYWSAKLNKKILKAKQGLIRQGDMICYDFGERVHLEGQCHWYSKGELQL